MTPGLTNGSSNFSTPLLDEKNALIKHLMQENERLRNAATEYMRVMEFMYDMELAEPEVTAALREALSNEVTETNG